MKKILVVDNHPVMLRFMTNLLEKEGHEVFTAQDGLSALDVLEKYRPDIIFVDIVMPNITGDKLCKIIRTMPGMSDVYIVILSAVAADLDLDFAELHVNACIAKGPLDKMAQNVLFALDQADSDPSQEKVGNEIIGVKGIFKREVSGELISSKRHLERLLNNMAEGILEINTDTRIVFVNDTAISIIGIPEERLLALPFTELFDVSCRENIRRLISAPVDSSLTIGDDTPLILNGKQVLLYILPFKDEQKETLTIIVNDITERRRMENQLLEAHKMESIATLAGGIAHQFNNALSVITGNLELLKMGPLNDAMQEFIDPMTNSAYRMSHLTSQLLAYARGGKYSPKTVSLCSFVEDTLPLIRHSVDFGIFIETNLPSDIRNIKADLTQMQMVISAVVANAGEAVEVKGYIRITASNVDIEVHPHLKPGPYACLLIEDDGKGMDEATKSRIFEPFFTTNFQGRGLGMAAVYGIIKNHGGWISVDSEEGKGTWVHIYLPAVDALKTEQKQKKPQFEKNSGIVLVIEDEPLIMDVSRTMLTNLGYSVLEAKTGEEAINIVRKHEGDIDLAILDIGLPDMGGEKLYPLLKEARTDLKVIVCSGYAIDGPAQEILDSGAQGFIQKPYAFGELASKLRDALDRES